MKGVTEGFKQYWSQVRGLGLYSIRDNSVYFSTVSYGKSIMARH